MIDAALLLAQAGVSVFPVGPDKAPRTPRGFYDATTDEATIRAWNWEGCGIGSPPAEGVIVVDIDPRNGGDNTLALFPELPPTRTTRTRSGGRHLWLRVDPHQKLRGVLGPGIDVKRHGKGYVVIPPSPGYVYVRGGDPAPAPDWLIDELRVQEFDPDEAADPKFFPFQIGTPYGEAALRNTLQRLAEVDNGARNDELNKAAFGLAQLSAGGELSMRRAVDDLVVVATEVMRLSDWEARHTIESGWKAGSKVPRQAPERVTA